MVAKTLSVRETEQLVRRLKNPPQKTTRVQDPDIRRLELRLSEQLCAKVKLTHSAKGKGKLVISYNTLEELEGILDHIR